MKYTDNLFWNFVTNNLSSEEMKEAEALVVANAEADAAIFASMACYDTISDQIEISEEDEDYYSYIYSKNTRISAVYASNRQTSKNNASMETMKLKKSEIDYVKTLAAQFAESEDKEKTLKENLVEFFMGHFSDEVGRKSATETIERIASGITTFNEQLSEALKKDLEAGKVDYLEALSAVGSDMPLKNRFELYASFLILLETLEADNLNLEEMSFKESYEAKKHTRFVIPQGEEVSQEMLNEVLEKINYMLENSSFCLSTIESSRSLLDVLDDDKLAFALIDSEEEDLRAKMIMATCTYIGVKSGEITALAPETKPEFVALGVAAGIEEQKVLANLANGNLDENKAVQVLKIIGAVVLITALVVASAYLASTIAAGIGVGLFILLGQGLLAMLVSSVLGVAIICTLTVMFTFLSVKLVEFALSIFDVIIDIVQSDIKPKAIEAWRAIKVWVKSKLSIFFDDQDDDKDGDNPELQNTDDEQIY